MKDEYQQFDDYLKKMRIGRMFRIASEHIQKDCAEIAILILKSNTFKDVMDDGYLIQRGTGYIYSILIEETGVKTNETPDPSNREKMYWFGYLIGEWLIDENITPQEIIDQYDIEKILDMYSPLHTVSTNVAIEYIKEGFRK